METVCHICGQLDGVASRDLLARVLGGDYVRRVSIESSDFGVFPSLGALVVGHVLVVPKVHWRSLAECPRPKSSNFDEFILRLREGLQGITGQRVHAFEHGSGREGSIACSIEHAHQHLVPSDVDIDLPDLYGTTWESIPSGVGRLSDQVRAREYLYYSPYPTQSYVAVLPEGIHAQSQLMRRVFASSLGIKQWDWRADHRVDEVRGTLELLKRLATSSTHPILQTA
jgi:diadenosine tetraphosphate (Ap4A) HIT family hydrolase